MKYFKLFCTMLIALLILTPIVCLGNDTNNVIDYDGDTFQDYDLGTSIIGVGGWHADPGDDVVIAVIVSTNMTYDEEHPISGSGAGDSQVLNIETGSNVLTNEFTGSIGTNAYVDFLVQMTPADKHPGVITNDNLIQTAVYLNSSSNLVVFHCLDGGDGYTNKYTELTNYTHNAGDWIRLTITMDFTTGGGFGHTWFQIRVNGNIISNNFAYTNASAVPAVPYEGEFGSWFASANNLYTADKRWLSSVGLSGAGLFDNFDATVFSPFATMYTVTVASVVGGDIWPGQTNEVSTASEIFFQASNGFYISLITRDGENLPPATNYPVDAPNISTTVVITATFATNATDNSISNNVPAEWMQKVLSIYTNDYASAAADDPDLDGYSTADEFLMSSDPFDSNDVLRISAVGFNEATRELKWTTTSYDSYYWLPAFGVQRSTNMLGGPVWEDITAVGGLARGGPGLYTNVVTLPDQTEKYYYYQVIATNTP